MDIPLPGLEELVGVPSLELSSSSSPKRAVFTLFSFNILGFDLLKRKAMTNIIGQERRLQSVPMVTSSEERKMKPEEKIVESLLYPDSELVLNHKALPSMVRRRKTKQQATLWHLVNLDFGGRLKTDIQR